MEDREVIKALECCAIAYDCPDCPFECDCGNMQNLVTATTDLLNRQKAKIERLEKARQKQAQFLGEERGQKYELINKITKAKFEAKREFSEKIDEVFLRYEHLHSDADCAEKDYIKAVDETEIEMQSVWDVFTLKNNEMAEYEEMNRLQTNIETIAKERLLTELEKDFRLLKKEMVGEE